MSRATRRVFGSCSYFFYENFYISTKGNLMMTAKIETGELPKMLTIREVASTGLLPEHALRQLVREGKIPCVFAGRKALICFSRLCEMLASGELR